MDEPLKAKIIDLLARHNFMTLATVRSDGFPQATIVYYVNSGLILHFATDPDQPPSGGPGPMLVHGASFG